MTKTFREVIADIKEGEVWEGSKLTIDCQKGKIITSINKGDKRGYMVFKDDDMFTLKRRLYTFAEAFAAYERGVEIESLKTGTKYKKEDNLDCWFSKVSLQWSENNDDFGIEEIRGKWYINR